MERETGIEPAPSAWKAEVLPLNYSRPDAVPAFAVACGWVTPKAIESVARPGGGRWIRTTEGVSQQIYSLPPLAAWVSLQQRTRIVGGTRGSVNNIGGFRLRACEDAMARPARVGATAIRTRRPQRSMHRPRRFLRGCQFKNCRRAHKQRQDHM